MEDLIKVAEQAFNKTPEFPDFRPGDTISVAYKIIEGNKERIQVFRGVVIRISGHGDQRRGLRLRDGGCLRRAGLWRALSARPGARLVACRARSLL